jgi:dTDP-glucose 4,6-dehydratase
MKVLITGGAGFIGSNYIRYVLDRHPGWQVVNLDALTYAGNPDNLLGVDDTQESAADGTRRYTFVHGDISHRDFVMELFHNEKFDAVINFAAESHVDRSISEPDIFVRTNVVGTQILLDASRITGVSRYVQVSTDEVYGSLGPTGYFTEETPLSPNSPYSASKAGADLLVRAYQETYGLNTSITRCSNNYGPYQFPEKLIPLIISRALVDDPVPVYGDGLNIRDWLYVEDHCEAVDLVLQNGAPGGIYNIGGHNERTNIDIVQTVLNELGKPESLITYVADRLGHDRRYAIDASKIERELGWRPSRTFETGIRETVQWYMTNKAWLENIRQRHSSKNGGKP